MSRSATVLRRGPKWIGAVVAAGVIATSGTASAAEPMTAEQEAAHRVAPSIVYLETSWKAWVDVDGDRSDWLGPYEWVSTCTGFVVNGQGYIVTAGHCVDDTTEGARRQAIELAVDEAIDAGNISSADRARYVSNGVGTWLVEGHDSGSAPDRVVTVYPSDAGADVRNTASWPARVVESQSLSEGDIALLKVEQSGLPAILLGDGEDVQVGTEVLSVGYPGSRFGVTDLNLDPTFKGGTINSRTTRGNGLLPVYEMDAAVSGGMSGGPTVDHDGRVVGVNSFSIRGETEAFNFISPVSLVREMLSRNGVANELSDVDKRFGEGVDALASGDASAALAAFNDVLDRRPGHARAQQLRVEAINAGGTEQPAEAPAPPVDTTDAGSDGGSMLPILAVAAVLVMGAVAGGLAFARRSRSGRPSGMPPVASARPTWTHSPTAECTDCGRPVPVTARFCDGCAERYLVTHGSRNGH